MSKAEADTIISKEILKTTLDEHSVATEAVIAASKADPAQSTPEWLEARKRMDDLAEESFEIEEDLEKSNRALSVNSPPKKQLNSG